VWPRTGDGEGYDKDYEEQERWKKRQMERHRIMNGIAMLEGQEPEETDSDVSWMGYSDNDEGDDETRLEGRCEVEGETEETVWADEMAYDLGYGCWVPVSVVTTSRIMPISNSDRKLVEIVEMDVI
jgi:hypothetical protein